MFSTQEQPTQSGFISMNELANSPTLLNRMCSHMTVSVTTRDFQCSVKAENQTLAENEMFGHQNVWVPRLKFVWQVGNGITYKCSKTRRSNIKPCTFIRYNNKDIYFVLAILNCIRIRHNNVPVCLKLSHSIRWPGKRRCRYQNCDSMSIRTNDIGPYKCPRYYVNTHFGILGW